MTSDCANIIVEDFINEIENWSAIWDLKHDDYSNKNAKRNAWEAVISKFVPNFNDMSEAEKKVIGNSYQRKWKSLRDSYTRELAKQKNEIKSVSVTKFRKKYIFFDQLRFLDSTTKLTDDSIELSDHEGNLEEIDAVAEENINKMPCKGKPKKRHSDEDLLEVLKKLLSTRDKKKFGL
ncbi:uncharacterized protein LOC103308185 [Acyrthosiphon pisum]|uniref:MADF domain-containing protein n=1 Tax=Acyrthosiphon pisum TaxID=7029 RepID=A0A8R1WYQ3_ACYPI|nr:uncharacterized protein LOC103308185 [Acyrthosiphon pisum]|eukprot:XP_008179367.1 PREDICTED: uncharacterized protein LOC103308185 [Acyrthosiphon pisum]